jgi:hypothetical protein
MSVITFDDRLCHIVPLPERVSILLSNPERKPNGRE